MKVWSLLELLLVNAVFLYLLSWFSADSDQRLAYWKVMGFSPTTTRYPFLLITSATSGHVSIPGLLSVDWLQVVGALLVAADVTFLWLSLRGR